MNITTMKLSDLVKPKRNVRIHTEQQLKEYKKSLEQFGQTKPFVVDENNVILIGNGLYDAMISLGYETGAVDKRTDLSENNKKKLMIADNKIFGLGIDNLDTLNEFLEELAGDLDIPGFDEEILKQMVSDAEEVTEKIAEYGTLDDAEIANIKANAARQEQKITSMESKNSGFDSNLADNPQKLADGITGEGMAEETTEIRKFVICPNCGEKIWL